MSNKKLTKAAENKMRIKNDFIINMNNNISKVLYTDLRGTKKTKFDNYYKNLEKYINEFNNGDFKFSLIKKDNENFDKFIKDYINDKNINDKKKSKNKKNEDITYEDNIKKTKKIDLMNDLNNMYINFEKNYFKYLNDINDYQTKNLIKDINLSNSLRIKEIEDNNFDFENIKKDIDNLNKIEKKIINDINKNIKPKINKNIKSKKKVIDENIISVKTYLNNDGKKPIIEKKEPIIEVKKEFKKNYDFYKKNTIPTSKEEDLLNNLERYIKSMSKYKIYLSQTTKFNNDKDNIERLNIKKNLDIIEKNYNNYKNNNFDVKDINKDIINIKNIDNKINENMINLGLLEKKKEKIITKTKLITKDNVTIKEIMDNYGDLTDLLEEKYLNINKNLLNENELITYNEISNNIQSYKRNLNNIEFFNKIKDKGKYDDYLLKIRKEINLLHNMIINKNISTIDNQKPKDEIIDYQKKEEKNKFDFLKKDKNIIIDKKINLYEEPIMEDKKFKKLNEAIDYRDDERLKNSILLGQDIKEGEAYKQYLLIDEKNKKKYIEKDYNVYEILTPYDDFFQSIKFYLDIDKDLTKLNWDENNEEMKYIKKYVSKNSNGSFNRDKDDEFEYDMIELIKKILLFIKNKYDVKKSEAIKFYILKSVSPNKISYHIIYNDLLFNNMKNLKIEIGDLLVAFKDEPLFKFNFIDRIPYNNNQLVRLINNTKKGKKNELKFSDYFLNIYFDFLLEKNYIEDDYDKFEKNFLNKHSINTYLITNEKSNCGGKRNFDEKLIPKLERKNIH